MPGPPPKREAERRRRNKTEVETIKVDVETALSGPVEIPAPLDHWEELTEEMYLSLARSGQMVFYEPSDWLTALGIFETLDRALKPQLIKVGDREIETIWDVDDEGHETKTTGKDYVFEERLVPIPASTLTAILKGLGDLMATEGQRRRLRIELERKSALDKLADGENVISIVAERDQLFEDSSTG